LTSRDHLSRGTHITYMIILIYGDLLRLMKYTSQRESLHGVIMRQAIEILHIIACQVFKKKKVRLKNSFEFRKIIYFSLFLIGDNIGFFSSNYKYKK
jgi:hypothetical protein